MLLFTFANPWVPRPALVKYRSSSCLLSAVKGVLCCLPLALGWFWVGVWGGGGGELSGCFLVCDVGREIKGDRVLAALGFCVFVQCWAVETGMFLSIDRLRFRHDWLRYFYSSNACENKVVSEESFWFRMRDISLMHQLDCICIVGKTPQFQG